MKTIKVPDIDALEKEAARVIDMWAHPEKSFSFLEEDLDELKKEFENRKTQDWVAKEKFELPWVRRKDLVLVFAGSHGDTSHKIKKGRVIHTDADPKKVKDAKQKHNFAGNVFAYRVMDMYHLLTDVGKIDWLYTFEPFHNPSPLFTVEALATVQKGIYFHFQPFHFFHMRPRQEEYTEVALKVYKANTYLIKKGPIVYSADEENEPTQTHFIVIRNSFLIRSRAKLDRGIINLLNKQKGTAINLEQIQRMFAVRFKSSLKKSLKRINKIVEVSKCPFFEAEIENF